MRIANAELHAHDKAVVVRKLLLRRCPRRTKWIPNNGTPI